MGGWVILKLIITNFVLDHFPYLNLKILLNYDNPLEIFPRNILHLLITLDHPDN